jgi:peroxiredoxin Q/BCP
MPRVGEKAPDFELLDDAGNKVKLSMLRGQRVVLYFYPKADTPGCTVEACSFRDSYAAYKKKGVVLLGVSPDTVKKQAKFKSKFELPFPLLADEDHQVSESYGVWQLKKFMGKEYMGVVRTTFLIGADGKIMRVFEGVKPEGHGGEVLEAL